MWLHFPIKRPELDFIHYLFLERKLQDDAANSLIHCSKKVPAQHWAPLDAITAAVNHRGHLASHLHSALPESEAKDHSVRKYHQQLRRLHHLLRDFHQEVQLPSQNQLRGRIGGLSYFRTSNILECHFDPCRGQKVRSFGN